MDCCLSDSLCTTSPASRRKNRERRLLYTGYLSESKLRQMAGKTRARRPLNRQSSRKYDATPSSGTSPLASYKEAPLPPHPPGVSGLQVRPAVKLYSMKENL